MRDVRDATRAWGCVQICIFMCIQRSWCFGGGVEMFICVKESNTYNSLSSLWPLTHPHWWCDSYCECCHKSRTQWQLVYSQEPSSSWWWDRSGRHELEWWRSAAPWNTETEKVLILWTCPKPHALFTTQSTSTLCSVHWAFNMARKCQTSISVHYFVISCWFETVSSSCVGKLLRPVPLVSLL